MEQGVIRVPLAPIRCHPDDRAEMVTQGLFGEALEWKVAPDADGWLEIRLSRDGYAGYTDAKLVATGPDAVQAFSGSVEVLHAPLTTVEWEGRPCHLPAGARLPEGLVPPHDNGGQQPVEIAAQFQGAPYLWGGKSILGIDCSGLTQLACGLCGLDIPRDAAQQWRAMQDSTVAFEGLRHGNLVFFHKQDATAITHVGFAWMTEPERPRVLHASGEVRIDPLTPAGIEREGKLSHHWTGATRLPVSAG